MRISDWSSDVCSSDLSTRCRGSVTCGSVSNSGVRIGLRPAPVHAPLAAAHDLVDQRLGRAQIGRESCRERVCQYGSICVVAVSIKKNRKNYIVQHKDTKLSTIVVTDVKNTKKK